jgi:hypothetical protein
MTGGWAMKVTIDPAIEKDPVALGQIRQANAYLEPQLGSYKNDVEARWTPRVNRPGGLSLSLRFIDDLPGEASDSFSDDILNRRETAAIWLRGVVDALFGQRAQVHLVRLRQMLSQLAHDDVNGEPEHAQTHLDRAHP